MGERSQAINSLEKVREREREREGERGGGEWEHTYMDEQSMNHV